MQMYTRVDIVIFIGFVAYLQDGFAQSDCVPDHVGNITLDLNYTLYWQPSTNCNPTDYLVYIHTEDGLQFIYNIVDPYLDVSFLPACEIFYFEVRAFTEHQLSDERHLEADIPAPSGANLTMSSFSVIQEDETLFLIWAVEEKFEHCARGFRIVVREDWNVLPRDIYTRNNYLFLDGFVPCGKYEIGVMAIYNEVMEGPIALATYTTPSAHTNPPTLQMVTPGVTYANISFHVDSYSVNRCPIVSIIVDGSPYFREQIYPVQDSPERPALNISVTPLQPDKMYLLNVQVVNSFGRSRPYRFAVQTLMTGSN